MALFKSRLQASFKRLRKEGYICRSRQTSDSIAQWNCSIDGYPFSYWYNPILLEEKFVFTLTSEDWKLNLSIPPDYFQVNIFWRGDLDLICGVLEAEGLNVFRPDIYQKQIKITCKQESV